MEYAGFWKRFGAYWLDFIIFLPFTALSLWGNEYLRLFQLYWFVPSLIIIIWFNVYLVQKYGGTPGKLLLKIKVVKVDGSDIGYKEAILRYSVDFVLILVLSAALDPIVLGMTDAEYFSMDWKTRSIYIVSKAPHWYNFVQIAMTVWGWSEFLVMLTNKKRRALHDFIAGTVVIRKQFSNESIIG